MAVVANAPSGIPGQAEGGYGFAAQQGFKTHLRGNAVDFVGLLQEGNRMDVFGQQADVSLLRDVGQVAFAFAAQNVGMGFNPGFRLWVFL